MSKSDQVGLFASLVPPIFIGKATSKGCRIPKDSQNSPVLAAYMQAGEECDVWETDNGIEIFGCQCMILNSEETEDILNAGLQLTSITIKEYLEIQEEVFSGAGVKDD